VSCIAKEEKYAPISKIFKGRATRQILRLKERNVTYRANF